MSFRVTPQRLLGIVLFGLLLVPAFAAAPAAAGDAAFPLPLETYPESGGILETLRARIDVEPFNLVASIIFLCAIVHTFLSAKFRHWAHEVEEAHAAKLNERRRRTDNNADGVPDEVSFKGQILHFLGEVEAVFGIWVVVLAAALAWTKGWDTVVHYIGH